MSAGAGAGILVGGRAVAYDSSRMAVLRVRECRNLGSYPLALLPVQSRQRSMEGEYGGWFLTQDQVLWFHAQLRR